LPLPLAAELHEISNGLNKVTFSGETGVLALSRIEDRTPFAQTTFGLRDVTKVSVENGTLVLEFRTDALHFTLPRESPFVRLDRRIRNPAPNELHLEKLGFPNLTLDVLNLKAPKLRAYGSASLSGISRNKGSETFQAVVDPVSRSGVVSGWLTRSRGSGHFATKIERGKCVLESFYRYHQLVVEGGKTLETETLVIGFFPDARLGLERFAKLSEGAHAEIIRHRSPLAHLKKEALNEFLGDSRRLLLEWRAVDAFDRSPPRIWQAQAGDVNFVAIFNSDPAKEQATTTSLEKLGLREGSYRAYDIDEKRELGRLDKKLTLKVPSQGSRVIALRK